VERLVELGSRVRVVDNLSSSTLDEAQAIHLEALTGVNVALSRYVSESKRCR
jgi:hypothetical protein